LAQITLVGYNNYKSIETFVIKGKPVEKLGRKAMGLKYGEHAMAAGCQRETDSCLDTSVSMKLYSRIL
jgi:hypothetical protein